MEAEPSIASADEVSELWSALDWKVLWPKMVSHTVATMRRRHRLKGSNEELIMQARELVEDLLNKVFVTRKRKWNRVHYPNAEDFFFDGMESQVSNWLKKRQSILRTTVNVDLEETQRDSSNPADGKLCAEDIRTEFVEMLQEMKAEDDEMLIFYARVDEGLTKPEDIRENTGMTEAVYHNAVRKLGRKLVKIRSKLGL